MLKIGGNALTIAQLHAHHATASVTLLTELRMRPHPICTITAVLSLLAIHSAKSEECAVSVRSQSEVKANWNSEVPEEWTGLSDCKLKLYHHSG